MKTTHLPHLLGAPPGPARQLAGRLGAIVEAATAVELERFVDDAAACPEHPRRCGRAVMAARVEGAVWWACRACLATGRVTGWEGTAVDRRQGLDGGTPMAASALAGPPWPSASGTFTTFAKFLIEELPPAAEVWASALRTPETVWNAVVVADVQGRREYLDQVRGAVAGTPLEIVVEVLAARKRRLYAVDWRVFHVTSVELRGGTMWVNVEARDGRG